MKKLWHLYFAKMKETWSPRQNYIHNVQAGRFLALGVRHFNVRKHFQYINFDLGHHCKSSEHNRWIKTNGNRYSFWNAYTRYTYMLRKLVINQAKMLHCFEECASNFPQKILSTRLCGRQNLVLWLDPPPTCEKLNRLILADPLAGPRAFICLASLCWWCSFFLSSFLSLYTTTPLYHSGSTVR